MKLKFIFTFLFLLAAQTALAYPVRIISLKPNITEILFALGAGNRVVGVTKYCDYPEEAKRLPRVADYTRPFAEKIIALKPDLIIGSREESSRKSILEFQDIGIKVEIFPFTTLEETMSSIRGIANVVGEPQKGEEIVKKMNAQLEAIKKKWEKAPQKRTLAVVGKRPLIVFGKETYMDKLMSLIGAQNVVPQSATKYPRWSFENVIASDPEVIIDMSMGSEVNDEAAALKSWGSLVTVKAVREKRIYPIDISRFRQSPRILDEIEMLAAMIHSP